MIDWMARARAEVGESRESRTAKTDESRVVSVSSAALAANSPTINLVSSVSTAPVQAIAAQSGPCATNQLTTEQADECHLGGWCNAEIAAFINRAASFALSGRADAEQLAERLTLRDRDGDDRRLCLECTGLADTGRCLAAAAGRIDGADRRLEPVQTTLQRCPAFVLRQGLI